MYFSSIRINIYTYIIIERYKKLIQKDTGVYLRINYVLIDYENVQPKNIEALNKEHYKVIVFYGSNQVKFKSELVTAIQEMRDRAEYIKIDGNGKNALDFHIAFYIGQLAEQNPKSFFHIISKDTGYDPLIKHLKSKNILACRSIDISEMPKPIEKAVPEGSVLNPKQISKATTIIKASDEKPLVIKVVTPKATSVKKSVEKVVAVKTIIEKLKIPSSKKDRLDMAVSLLKKKGIAIPKTTKALLNIMKSIFRNQLSEKDIQAIFDEMQKQKIIIVNGAKVTYNLSNPVVKNPKPIVAKTNMEKAINPKPLSENLTKIITALKKREMATPKTTKALLNAIDHICGKKLPKPELLNVFNELKKQGIVIVSTDDKMKVTYNLERLNTFP